VGLDLDSAAAIGAANQEMDNENNSAWGGYENRTKYHFTTPEQRHSLWRDFVTSGSLSDFGSFMHAHQDSHSHEGYGPDVGHWWTEEPDLTQTDPAKADRMAETSYNWLDAAADRLPSRRTSVVVPWNQVSPFVQRFKRAQTDDEKRKILKGMRNFIEKARRDEQKRRQEEQKNKKKKKQTTSQ